MQIWKIIMRNAPKNTLAISYLSIFISYKNPALFFLFVISSPSRNAA
jgi:hypothetical protein